MTYRLKGYYFWPNKDLLENAHPEAFEACVGAKTLADLQEAMYPFEGGCSGCL